MPRIEGTDVGGGHFRPLITISVTRSGARAQGSAMVDSGADMTVIPAEIAELLGVAWMELPQGLSGQGAGGNFEVRTLDAAVKWRSWDICDVVSVAAPGSLQMPLLGRNDFFAKFVVRFNWHRNPPWVQIDPAVNPKSPVQPKKRKRK